MAGREPRSKRASPRTFPRGAALDAGQIAVVEVSEGVPIHGGPDPQPTFDDHANTFLRVAFRLFCGSRCGARLMLECRYFVMNSAE